MLEWQGKEKSSNAGHLITHTHTHTRARARGMHAQTHTTEKKTHVHFNVSSRTRACIPQNHSARQEPKIDLFSTWFLSLFVWNVTPMDNPDPSSWRPTTAVSISPTHHHKCKHIVYTLCFYMLKCSLNQIHNCMICSLSQDSLSFVKQWSPKIIMT